MTTPIAKKQEPKEHRPWEASGNPMAWPRGLT
ncbi:hypothetical protein RF55_21445, partial [Lasius niger]